MALTPWTWYTRDTALHSYVAVLFLITLPFSVFNTYVFYQLQIVGFLIGTDAEGGPCTDYCIVDWAGSRLDVNSVLLYLNALGFGLGGAVTFILCAYADYWSIKHLLVTCIVICFGAFAAPAYWLQEYSQHNFNALSALFVLYAIVTLIIMALLNVYIPYCMRTRVDGVIEAVDNATEPESEHTGLKEGKRRTYGFKMSAFGQISNGAAGIIMLIIVIILTQILPSESAQSAGLLVTTVTGFITIAGSAIAYFGLPRIPAKEHASDKSGWYQPALEFLRPLKDLVVHKNLAALLVSYTIYTDTAFALYSVTNQLFIIETAPNTLDISLFALSNYIFLLACTTGFLLVRPYIRFIKLETWLTLGLALQIVIPVWGCIGLAPVNFGFKSKWEFYVQLFVFNLSGALVNTSFRVLFSELVPARSEFRWFGMQLVLSCATTWINYVASAPLQNATHQLRFPLIFSLIFLLIALAVELFRHILPVFKHDRERWINANKIAAAEQHADQSGEDQDSGEHITVTTKV